MNRRDCCKTILQLLGICLVLSHRMFSHSQANRAGEQSQPYYVDIAEKAGINSKTTIQGHPSKDFLLSTTGGGVALFDYDNDGWLDLFLVNGWGLRDFPKGEEPTNRLYRNNRDGTFLDVTSKAGLVSHSIKPKPSNRTPYL